MFAQTYDANLGECLGYHCSKLHHQWCPGYPDSNKYQLCWKSWWSNITLRSWDRMPDSHRCDPAVHDERRTIADWLSSLNFMTKQNDVFEERTECTGQWLLSSEGFKAWLFGGAKILWCPGIREMLPLSTPFFSYLIWLDSWSWKDYTFVRVTNIATRKGRYSCRVLDPL